MYIIEFENSWKKKNGKLSFCRVIKEEDNMTVAIDEYVENLKELIETKIEILKLNNDLSESETNDLKDLIVELANVTKMINRENAEE